MTKNTDMFYFNKRKIINEYDPSGNYDFYTWEHYLNIDVAKIYENMHKDLLYTNEKQDMDEAIETLRKISNIFKEIEE